jgi:hypothetical protein
MSKFICQSCPERCSLFCAQNASEIPTRCQFVGKANWVVEDKPPVYYTLPAPAAEPEIDYKKLSEILCKALSGKFDFCSVCKSIGGKCVEHKPCGSVLVEAAKLKYTKGGE